MYLYMHLKIPPEEEWPYRSLPQDLAISSMDHAIRRLCCGRVKLLDSPHTGLAKLLTAEVALHTMSLFTVLAYIEKSHKRPLTLNFFLELQTLSYSVIAYPQAPFASVVNTSFSFHSIPLKLNIMSPSPLGSHLYVSFFVIPLIGGLLR